MNFQNIEMKKIEELIIYSDKISYIENNRQKEISLNKHMLNSEFNILRHNKNLLIDEFYSILCIGFSDHEKKQYNFYAKKGSRNIYLEIQNKSNEN